MKTQPFLSALGTAITLLTISLCTAGAQGPQPATRDPFLKERGAPTSVPDTAGNPVAITVVFETYALGLEDAESILKSPPDATARYRRIKELVSAGRTRLEDFQATAVKPGRRAIVETADVVMLPSEFHPPENREAPAMPSALSQVQYGDRLELEAILGTDGRTCNLNFNLEMSRLLGFREYRAGGQAQPQASPSSEKRQIISSVVLRAGDPVLLGTASRPRNVQPAGKAETSLVFARIVVNKDRPEGALPPASAVGFCEHLFSFYSMDRAAAREVLAEEGKPGACFAGLRALVEKKGAKLEHVLSIPSQSGMRTKSDENVVIKQPGGASPIVGLTGVTVQRNGPQKSAPADGGNALPAVARTPYFPTMSGKNVGLSVELDSVTGPTDAVLKGIPSVVDVSYSLSWRDDLGNLKADGVLAHYPETGVQEGRRSENAVSCYAGVPTFLCTLSPPRETGINGRKDSGRVWLVFLRVTPVNP